MDDFIYYLAIIILILIVFAIFYYLFFPSENFEIKHQNKIENFKTKIKILENKINNKLDVFPDILEIPNIDKERELFELYYKGIPDTYDTRGNLIRGVEPSALKAINYLKIIINSQYGTHQDILRLARIYHYGMHMFERDLDKAEKIYNELKFENVTQETYFTIKEALSDIQKIRVYTWLNIPLERPIINPDFVPKVNFPDNPRINNPPGGRIQQINDTRIVDTPLVDTPLVDKKDYNDPQNTHNPQVLSTIRQSLNKLKLNTPISKNREICSVEIRSYITKLDDSDKKQDALKSLNAIESNPHSLSSTDMTEMDALTLVWNRINDTNKFNNEINNNLKETLFDELASMQEFGTTICSTGRFTHIIDTLNGVDDEVSIKPTYAINEEMLTKSSKIREDMLNELSEIERKHMEIGTSQDQTEFELKLKNKILENLRKDYVDSGILTRAKFEIEVGKWIDDI